MINIVRSLLNGSTGFKEPRQTAELEIGGARGDRRAGATRRDFQTVLPFPTSLQELVLIRARRLGTGGQVVHCTSSWAKGPRRLKSGGS